LNRDFTVRKYSELLQAFKNAGYEFQTVKDFLQCPLDRVIIMRHDVDRIPRNALRMALVEHKYNIYSTYYFRTRSKIFNIDIINQIYYLGHEIGYHYEDFDIEKGNIDKAYISFKKNLNRLRSIVPIQTVCMHGSPMSKWDNTTIWEKYNYRELGVIGEPYFDIDYSNVFYLTDTGRKWNNINSNIRDRVNSSLKYNINRTDDIILVIKENILPNKIMINIHPHRWFNNIIFWYYELIYQGIKNMIKQKYLKKKTIKN